MKINLIYKTFPLTHFIFPASISHISRLHLQSHRAPHCKTLAAPPLMSYAAAHDAIALCYTPHH